MSTQGDRLREERERLGMTQAAFGAVGGVKKQAQLKYEKGERSPDAAYLEAVAAEGVDVMYVVTGARVERLLQPSEADLLRQFREASLSTKGAVLAVLNAEHVVKPVKQQVFNGGVGQVNQIDGNLNQSGAKITGKK